MTRRPQQAPATTCTEEPTREGELREEHVGEVPSTDPMFGVALLKMAMELKRPNAPGIEEVLRGVLTRMDLDEEAFSRYLATNGGLLRGLATRRKY